MPGQPLDALAARWAADPHPTLCAALADGLRKRGDLRGALALLHQGSDRFPEHVSLWLTLARTAAEMGDLDTAGMALGRALVIDPGHPLALEMATASRPNADQATAEADLEPLCYDETATTGGEGPVLVTESLAALYHRQGHLELALAAYAELAARDPANGAVAAHHAAIQREFAQARPLPYDAAETGGQSIGAWLARVAAAAPAPVQRADFDAFYEPPPAPVEATTDFTAFRRWLQELDR